MSELKKTLVVVDDDVSVLWFLTELLGEDYNVHTVQRGLEAVGKIKEIMPDMVLLDIIMPEIDGYEVIRRIKGDYDISDIPVVFLTAKDDSESEVDGLSLGAVDYINKPLDIPILRKRIEVHLLIEEQKRRLHDYNVNLKRMVDEKTEEITRLQDAILSTIAEFVEFRYNITGGHIERTKLYIRALTEKMLESKVYREASAGWDVTLLVHSAQLHDVGKIKIPDSILSKPGKLTEEEFEIVKNHTSYGKEAIDKIIKKVDGGAFLEHSAIMAYSHHERWDGTGYPLGLSGPDIPLEGRLMAIVDVYDALISDRPYKKAFMHEQAARIICEGKGTQFDPVLIALFEELSGVFYEISRMRMV